MKIETELKKWGNSLALRVTGAMAEVPDFKAGSRVVVEITEDGFTVRKISESAKRLPYTEQELLAGLSPESAHAEKAATLVSGEYGE